MPGIPSNARYHPQSGVLKSAITEWETGRPHQPSAVRAQPIPSVFSDCLPIIFSAVPGLLKA